MARILARFAALRGWAQLGLAALLGAIAGLGQAPFDLWPATIAVVAIALMVHQTSQTPRQAAFHAWGFGIGYFAFALHWIVEPFLVDIARHGWMAPFALALMAGGAALFWALAAYVAARIKPQSAVVFGIALVWTEATRSLILTGFPWALLGHIWVPTPVAQMAAFGGPHLLTLITVVTGYAIATLFTRRWLAGLGVTSLLAVAAWVLNPMPLPDNPKAAPVVRLVQPNAPQHQKWDPAYRQVFLDRMITMTGRGAVPDLVVWPETAIPTLLNYIVSDMSPLADAARGAPLVFGIQRRDEAGQYFNSMIVMEHGGVIRSIYDKQHLVPFGEYIPGSAWLGRAGMTGLARNLGSGFAAGQASGPIDLPGIGSAIPLICYEGIFAEEIMRGDRPRLLLLITNDAWFGQAAGPYQHLAQARLRAIEQGLPMVRVANTGVSAMIDGKGRVIDQIPLGIDGFIDVSLPPALPETLYARRGEWPFFLLLTILTFGGFTVRSRNSD